jgi:predicted permease
MNPANVALVQIDPSLSRYDQQQTQRLLLDVIRDAGSLPGARSVSVTNMLPLSLAGTINRVWPEGKGSSEGEQSAILVVGPRFFETTGTPLLAGSDFGTADSGDPSVIVNQELARRLFPGQNPIGRWVSNAGHRARIVAIASNTKYRMLQESGAMPILYEPILARDADAGSFGGLTLMVRTAQNPIGMGRMVQQRLRARDPELVINSVGTMDQHMHEALFLPRLAASLFGLCGAVGLFIATIGIYGVVSFSVARRTREIGIRMALGGRVSQVVWLVMRHGAAVTLAGIALGVGAGLLVARAAGSLIHGVSATDPLTFLCVPLLLFAIGMLATAIPARRAARVDPALALRAE